MKVTPEMQLELKRQAEARLRVQAIFEGIQRGVATDDYMDGEDFARDALEYQRRKGSIYPSLASVLKEYKLDTNDNGQD